MLKKSDFAIKSVCQRCMTETRVSLDHRSVARVSWDYGVLETRDPVPWNKHDEAYWDDGVVICPNAGSARTPDRKQCLRQKEIESIHSGCVSVWDNIRL